jgi:hypothetical protein
MATIAERTRNRLGSESAEIEYLIEGASNARDARALLLAYSPDEYSDLARTDAEVVEINGLSGGYDGRAIYGKLEDPPEATVSDSFEVAVTPTQVFTSRATISTHAPFLPFAPAVPDFQGAINVDADDRVNGVQWPPSTPQIISRSKVIASASVTESYYHSMSALVGHVNSNSYLGFNAGELLFLGASGTRRGVDTEDPWDITWKFGVSLNASSIPVGSGITIPSKDGWHYVWVHYRPRKDTSAKMLLPRPVAAYVEQIAPESSFSGLIL